MKDYASIFETLALDQKTLELSHSATITPTVQSTSDSASSTTTLPEFKMDQTIGMDPDFRIVETLGEGGMGVVSLAEQTALRRLVAVKEPKGADARAHGRVLDEALIMGRIEHPNVVPAYSLGRRRDGQPILVMKRVEGTSWEDVIRGSKEAPGGGEVDLVWHLRVLLQVCNALRFAHARRVVHRDIKPENVMIGEFGEVYLLDWGIALSLDPDADEGIPTAKTTRGLAGTPAFMAPEMTDDDASDIDERTDVYLLGANLHMLLTGEPPHQGSTLFAVCMSAYNSEPKSYAEHTPSELVDIARKAMSREKDDRYPSVSAFAAALSDYLEHRASYTLSDSARETLDEVLSADDDEDNDTRLLEAEFGFRQALTIWSENERARQGLQAAIEARVRSCIAREEAGGARSAYEQLPATNEELASSLRALEAELEARAERVDYLERFEAELDLKAGTRSRQRAVLILGLAFTALCFWQAWVARPGQVVAPAETWLDSYWRLVAIAFAGMLFYWKKLIANLANRRLVAFFISALVSMFLLRFAALHFTTSAMFLQIAEMCAVGMASFAIGVASNRRLAVVAVGYALAAFAAILVGEMWFALTALGLAHLAFFSAMVWHWRPSRTRDSG